MSTFHAEDGFMFLEFEHWTLVGNVKLGELHARLDPSSPWHGSRPGSDIKQLHQAMQDSIDASASGPFKVPMTEQGLTMLGQPADQLVREWREEWCL